MTNDSLAARAAGDSMILDLECPQCARIPKARQHFFKRDGEYWGSDLKEILAAYHAALAWCREHMMKQEQYKESLDSMKRDIEKGVID